MLKKLGQDMDELSLLLWWLFVYVSMLVGLSWVGGKPLEPVAALQNLVSGFAGAAFAVMRTKSKPGDPSDPA